MYPDVIHSNHFAPRLGQGEFDVAWNPNGNASMMGSGDILAHEHNQDAGNMQEVEVVDANGQHVLCTLPQQPATQGSMDGAMQYANLAYPPTTANLTHNPNNSSEGVSLVNNPNDTLTAELERQQAMQSAAIVAASTGGNPQFHPQVHHSANPDQLAHEQLRNYVSTPFSGSEILNTMPPEEMHQQHIAMPSPEHNQIILDQINAGLQPGSPTTADEHMLQGDGLEDPGLIAAALRLNADWNTAQNVAAVSTGSPFQFPSNVMNEVVIAEEHERERQRRSFLSGAKAYMEQQALLQLHQRQQSTVQPQQVDLQNLAAAVAREEDPELQALKRLQESDILSPSQQNAATVLHREINKILEGDTQGKAEVKGGPGTEVNNCIEIMSDSDDSEDGANNTSDAAHVQTPTGAKSRLEKKPTYIKPEKRRSIDNGQQNSKLSTINKDHPPQNNPKPTPSKSSTEVENKKRKAFASNEIKDLKKSPKKAKPHSPLKTLTDSRLINISSNGKTVLKPLQIEQTNNDRKRPQISHELTTIKTTNVPRQTLTNIKPASITSAVETLKPVMPTLSITTSGDQELSLSKDEAKLATSLAGPFIQSIITMTPHPMGKVEAVDGVDMNAEIRVATTKILHVAAMQKGNNSSSSSLSSLGTVSPVTEGACNVNDIPKTREDVGGSGGRDTATTKGVTLSFEAVESLAKFFVNDRFKVAKRAAQETAQISFIEMKKRHDGLMGALRGKLEKRELPCGASDISSNQEKFLVVDAARRQKEKESMMKKEMEKKVKNLEDEERKKTKLNEEKHKESLASLKQKYENETRDLIKEHKNFVKDLLEKHTKQVTSLKRDVLNGQKSHAVALNSYMAASCSALRLIRNGVRKVTS